MNAIKKFTTFEQLKSCEKKMVKYASSLKKHNDLHKVIMEIGYLKKLQVNQITTK
jgi:hypothetical protein